MRRSARSQPRTRSTSPTPRPPGARRPGSCCPTPCGRHGRGPADWRDEVADRDARGRPPRPRGLGGRAAAGSARRRRVRVRGPPERVRRCLRRAAQRQHRGVPHRIRRARHRPGDRRARAAPGAGRRRSPAGGGAARRVTRTQRRTRAVRRSPPRARRRPRVGGGGHRTRCGGLPGRYAGEPSRHRRGVDDRRRRRRGETFACGRRALARPQGVQHAERVRDPASGRPSWSRRSSPRCSAVGERPRRRRTAARHHGIRRSGRPVDRRIVVDSTTGSTIVDEPLAVDAFGNRVGVGTRRPR